MHIHRGKILALMGALFIVPAVASAQFRDLSKRPNTDTTAINEFIKSYHRKLEPLYVHQLSGPRFGPLASFQGRQFISESNETLPLESAESMVTMNTSSFQGLLVGATAGLAAATISYFILIHRVTSNSDITAGGTQPIWVIAVGPLIGGLIGGAIGALIPREENAAPMNAFRTR